MADHVLPEVLPILASKRFYFELRPGRVKLPEGGEADGYVWTHVRELGDRLTAEVSAIPRVPLLQASAIADNLERINEMLKLGKVEAHYKRQRLDEGIDAIPADHALRLAQTIYDLSAVGADPFVGTAAESPP